MADPQQRVHPLLLCEALGFSPQLLLDDIINIANNSVLDGVNGFEKYLEKAELQGDTADEVEQGLVAFQTLLEHHTDLAFDILEAWALRNIFAIPSDLPIVLPHHQNLDLTHQPQEEQELLEEVAELRELLEDQRRLRRSLTRAIRTQKAKRLRAEKRYENIALLDNHIMDTYSTLPDMLTTMYGSVSSHAALDPSTVATLSTFQMTEPGKRQWETSETGYLKWAVRQLWSRTGAEGPLNVDEMSRNAANTGKTEDLRTAGLADDQ